jgi:hypothetical protein
MSPPRRTREVKRLQPEQRISACVGDYELDENGRPTKKRKRLCGHIIRAAGEKQYLVRFDNGLEKVCFSNTLCVANIVASIPPDMPLPEPRNIQEQVNLEVAQETVADQAEEEHLPRVPPEAEDFEAEATEAEEQEHDLEDGIPGQLRRDEAVDIPEQLHDPEGRMPGQLARDTDAPRDYSTVKRLAIQKVRSLVGRQVRLLMKKNGQVMTWKVIDTHVAPNVLAERSPTRLYGLKNFNTELYKKSEILAKIFLDLAFLDWKSKVLKMNEAITKEKQNGLKVREFTNSEFLIALGITIGAAEFAQSGTDLFSSLHENSRDEPDRWPTLCSDAHFEKHMAFSRYKEFRRFFPSIWIDESKKATDDWFQFSSAVDEFNRIRRERVVGSFWLSIDESMSAWKPRTSPTGGLPNISFIARKPKPLGTEFKSAACPITGVIRSLEIQRGKQGMSSMKYNNAIGATAGCTLRLLEEAIPEEDKANTHGVRGDAWFGSVKNASELGIRGYECVFQIKNYNTLFPKDFIDEALKNAPGGVSIILEAKAPNEVPLVAVGYRYSRKTILYFVQTKNAGSSVHGEPYHMKYIDEFGNVHERNVDRPDVISKFYLSSNVIDNHNQMRQDSLALEEKWITHNCYFRLATTLIGISVIDSFLLAKYHKVIDCSKNEDTTMSVRRFAGALAYQLLHHASILSSDTVSKFKPEDVLDDSPPKSMTATSVSSISTITQELNFEQIKTMEILDVKVDAKGNKHTLVKYELVRNNSGKKRRLSRKCKLCLPDTDNENERGKDAAQYCFECGTSMALCFVPERDCYLKHVQSFRRETRVSSRQK